LLLTRNCCWPRSWNGRLSASPLMDDLAFFAVLAGCCYFAAGWVAHGSPRISYACVPGAVTVTLVLLLDVRFTIDIVPSLLNVGRIFVPQTSHEGRARQRSAA
jgi:hypothetical protein